MSNLFIISENEIQTTIPSKKKLIKDGRIRMECVLQTVGDVNRNKRRYSKELIESGLSQIHERIQEGGFLGELDHPIDRDPHRQMTVLYKDASHRILEYGWDGNKLVATLESLRSPNGQILSNFAQDGIPIGFSFRGMGELKEVQEGNETINDVVGPIHIITWDAVGHPSHKEAQLIKVTEEIKRELSESAIGMINESKSFIHKAASINEIKGLICTNEGICYLPNDFDRLVEQRIVSLVKQFVRSE